MAIGAPPPGRAVMTAQNAPGPATGAEIFLARQPILDGEGRTYGYELLYRAGPDASGPPADGQAATLRVFAAALSLIGLDALVGRTRAFVNVTREMLVSDAVYALPRERVVIEILEDVLPDREVLAACDGLHRRGYQLALDDFAFEPERAPLARIADIVKVDIRATTPEQRANGVRQRRPRQVFLAEKVEDAAEYHEVLALGYDLFQGYYFCRPSVFSRRAIPAAAERLHLLQLARTADLAPEELHEAIRADVGLAYGLMRYANSVAVGAGTPARDLWDAVMRLGATGTGRWLAIAILADLGGHLPLELLRTSVVRARACELLGIAAGFDDRRHDLFLLGLFSLMDVLLELPMGRIARVLPLHDEVHDALLGAPGRFRAVYDLALACERAEWSAAAAAEASLGLPAGTGAGAHRTALVYATAALGKAG